LAELGIDVLLCAAISQSMLRALQGCGIRVIPHLCGEVEAILQAFSSGHLRRSEFRMPGCWGQHLEDDCCRTGVRPKPLARAAGRPSRTIRVHED
jgi:predicted Fe-Mo cluster-binding NifX family protein